MKIYQLHKFGGEWEDSYDYIIGSYLRKERAEEETMKDITKDFEQGFQGWEYKFNTVASSRGDYPFITVTAGYSSS